MNNTNEFEQVDLSSFFDEQTQTLQPQQKFEMLTQKQKELLDEVLPIIYEKDPDKYISFVNRLEDLEALAQANGRFPSLLERHQLVGGERTTDSLIDSLVNHTDHGDQTLQLPSKAMLGKGLLVSKIHTLSSIAKYCQHVSGLEKYYQLFSTETILSMFNLLVEDVYLNLIRDTSQPIEFRKEWALSLILLWEHWVDSSLENIAPVLQSVWQARRKLAPAFGTMMGTSELLMISMQMDEQWIAFIKQKMGITDVTQAMEEFLFGISYEQIKTLRQILREKGIAAIGRDEVSKFLGEHVKADAGLDYRDFYSLYTVRRDNARAREKMHLEGPKKTLEDYFIQFVTEQNKEKQKNDTFAKS